MLLLFLEKKKIVKIQNKIPGNLFRAKCNFRVMEGFVT